MIFVILIALIIIALIATGLGVDFWVVVAVLVGLGVIFIIACSLMPDEEEKKKREAQKNNNKNDEKQIKRKKLISKILFISIPVVLVILIIGAIIGTLGLFDNSSSDAQYDHYMGGYDYGDNYYYDSNDNVVKEKLW
ncbi:MAG: hypothetical protein U0L11_06205 [Acutalibacteraceae bacterium]|nr:hypothetical protein [Acutalibacteraceae bacterium]